jgi:hypothetical protein
VALVEYRGRVTEAKVNSIHVEYDGIKTWRRKVEVCNVSKHGWTQKNE